MFEWLKKAFGDSEPERKRRREPEREFRPVNLPPRRAVPGALVSQDKQTGQVVYNLLTPHMKQFKGRCIGAIKRVGITATGTQQFSVMVGEQQAELRLDQFYQPTDDPALIEQVVAEARRITNVA